MDRKRETSILKGCWLSLTAEFGVIYLFLNLNANHYHLDLEVLYPMIGFSR